MLMFAAQAHRERTAGQMLQAGSCCAEEGQYLGSYLPGQRLVLPLLSGYWAELAGRN